MQRVGGKSWGLILSRDMLDSLGFATEERVRDGDGMTVVVDEVDGALVIRREGAVESTLDPALSPGLDIAPLKEWQQRLLAAVRDHGPATTVEIAAIVGRSREQTSTNLNKLRRLGLVERELGAGGWVLKS